MWPWGHLAVGYLCYLGVLRVRDDGKQTLLTLVAVAFGTQFPDLVDKPLAWTFGVLPSGRSFAHSLLVAAVVIGVAYWVASRRGHAESAVAFGVGYISHSLVDLGPEVVWGLVQGDWGQLQWTTYLLWPILSAPPYPNDESFMQHFVGFAMDPYVLVQFGLLGVAVALWIRSGRPGLVTLQRGMWEWIGRRDVVSEGD
ncbi:metal-dependent hydrolase [Halospeciosus flavus]|uniref:Metal-dependent hydrolase n=1 Tax=Halospeciosus flavus TaxID=3032283 RepID=A0ABD5Z3F7_9EURY|nr:metal-dependent hydrolase [Halospeciosus flavus]